MVELILVLLLGGLLAVPLGWYLALVMRGAAAPGDRFFLPIERALYAMLGRSAQGSMQWTVYAAAFLASNLALGIMVWLLLMTQAWLPLNPAGVPNMNWDLALHTAVSFLTNTNQQHYSGQAQISYLSHMAGIVALQMVTPMMGLALVVATLRALFGREVAGTDSAAGVGNFWVDVIRPTLRLLLPLCLVWSVALTSQGVPATLQGSAVATPLDSSAGLSEQVIPLGPVAPMVAIKQLGTNGGGWYGPNSAVPLENPTPLSNLLQMLAIVLLPMAAVAMTGFLTRRASLAYLIGGTMLALSMISAAATLWIETAPALPHAAAQMEGKEQRIGPAASAAWAALTTQTSNGSVNAMHDSMAPLTGLVLMSNMLINAVWGGVGCGLQQFLVYLLLSVFVAGLMTGRTPELFGRKIEAPELRLLAVLVLLQPLVVLGLTALAVSVPGLAGSSNPGFHGLSQVLYEYTSAFANNGSGFEGLGDATPWWNLSAALALLLGRYPALIIPLAIAARLGAKPSAPETAGSLPIETPTFALTLIGVMVILTLLQFMPVLVLGPVAAHLTLPTP